MDTLEALATVRTAVLNVEEYPSTPFKLLGIRKGLRVTLWLICHPYENSRLAVRLTKAGILLNIDEIVAQHMRDTLTTTTN